MKYISLIAVFLLLFSSCEKMVMKPDPANDPVSNFETLWNTVDQKYSFFQYKNIDWDSVYNVYMDKIDDNTTGHELFDYCAEALFALRDGHVNIISTWDVSRNWDWMLDYPENLNMSIVERNYLDKDYWRTGALNNQIIDSTGYIYYGSFGSGVSDEQMDIVLERFVGLRGIIIDVRGNGGGSLGNVETIAGRFTPEEYVFGSYVQKSGPEHDSFTEPIELRQKVVGENPYTGTVVILTNRGCYSATNDFAARMKALENVTIMGDKTGGGGGLPIYNELPNGWRYRFSSTITYDVNGNNIEGGIAPDIYISLDPADEANGLDTMIEAALEYIRMKNRPPLEPFEFYTINY